jgi:tetratricopeptide (TPR) repeat protein
MKRILAIFLTGLILSSPAVAQKASQNKTHKDTYLDLLNRSEFDALFRHLKKWEKENPDDPEMYIGYFNYYISRSKKEVVAVEKKGGTGSGLVITDPESGKTEGYLNPRINFNEADVRKAISHLDAGLQKYPDRLDMHIGKVYILGEIGDFDAQKKQLAAILDRSAKNNNRWYWSDGSPLPDGKNRMLEEIQARLGNYYEAKSDIGNRYLFEISSRMIALYPGDIYGYNNIAAIYTREGKNEEALKYLKQAEAINPKDLIVINNIANLYRNTGSVDLAVHYYKKMIQLGDDETRDYAKKQIELLKADNKTH